MRNRAEVVAEISVYNVTTLVVGEVIVHTSHRELGVQPWAESVLLRR